jgi:hypothetical protein
MISGIAPPALSRQDQHSRLLRRHWAIQQEARAQRVARIEDEVVRGDECRPTHLRRHRRVGADRRARDAPLNALRPRMLSTVIFTLAQLAARRQQGHMSRDSQPVGERSTSALANTDITPVRGVFRRPLRIVP